MFFRFSYIIDLHIDQGECILQFYKHILDISTIILHCWLLKYFYSKFVTSVKASKIINTNTNVILIHELITQFCSVVIKLYHDCNLVTTFINL